MTRSQIAVLASSFILLLVMSHNPIFAHDPAISPLHSEAKRREMQITVRDFSLIDQDGNPVRFRTLRGKIILVAFAYTTCPDVCPLITAAMRSVQNRLGPGERSAVYLLTITTDPEIDNPRVLSSYAKRHGADLSNWAFLTGDPKPLAEVWKNFGVRVQRKARGLIDHTTLTAVIDRKGTMRFAYHGTSPDPKTVLADIRRLLAREPA